MQRYNFFAELANFLYFCGQIVMFVMQKDFNYASESISHKVGKMYRLEKVSETEAYVKEEIL